MTTEKILCLGSEKSGDIFWVAYSTLAAKLLRQEQKQLEVRSFSDEISPITLFWVKIEIKEGGKLRVTDVNAPKRKDKFIDTLPPTAQEGLVNKVGRAQVAAGKDYREYFYRPR